MLVSEQGIRVRDAGEVSQQRQALIDVVFWASYLDLDENHCTTNGMIIKIGTAEEEEAFFEAMNKLAEYLNKRKQDAPDVSPVSFKFLRRFGELSDCDGGKGAAADERITVGRVFHLFLFCFFSRTKNIARDSDLSRAIALITFRIGRSKNVSAARNCLATDVVKTVETCL